MVSSADDEAMAATTNCVVVRRFSCGLEIAPRVDRWACTIEGRFRGERSAPRDYSMAEDAEAAPAEVDEFEAIKLKYNALKAPVLWERELYTTSSRN